MGRLRRYGITPRDRSLLYTHTGDVQPEDELTLARLIPNTFIDADAAVFTRCLLDHARVVSGVSARFHRCSLDSVDAANANMDRSAWMGTLVETSRLTGTRFNHAFLQDQVFDQCVMPHVQFQLAKGERIRFEHCDLRGAYFNQSSFPGVVFSGCNLRGADFSGANIEGADLRRSQIEDIRIGPEQLQRVIVSSDQAIYLARLIGLDVRE